MAPTKFRSFSALEENSADVYKDSTEVLIKIARNVLNEPTNPKFRSISLGSNVVSNKLLPASGAMECLFEMGFQEGEDKLILPQGTPLGPMKYIHDELLRRKQFRAKAETAKPVKVKQKKVDSIATLIAKDLTALVSQKGDSFQKKIIFWCFYVLKYEDYDLQKKALQLIPLVELNINVMKNIRKIQLGFKKKLISDEAIDHQEMLLRELCNWFNTEFFSWVDTPKCDKCGFIETVHIGISNDVVAGADRVEEYKCEKCNAKVLFPRYSDPEKLLETRRGRCGEWANCFCLFCRALGWDSRLVFDATDHVWVEVYSILKSKWIHCDPCENAVDTPLMYEYGWKKKLSYVIAYSKDEIQDVTWRYSSKHAEVLKNRKKCSEVDLIDFIIKVRNVMLSKASPTRRNFVLKRTALELVELMKQNTAGDDEGKERISGSLAWRLLRGEASDFQPYVWKIEKDDEERKKFVLSYKTSKDEYYRNSKPTFKNWRSGLYKMDSIFKKNEKDWKMTYLARSEGADSGSLAWKFETGDKCSIGSVELKLLHKTFESGVVSCKLCSDDSCVIVPNDKEVFVTDAFSGSKFVEVSVNLSGGNGPNAWQHAQILRQSLNSEDNSFSIVLNLIEH